MAESLQKDVVEGAARDSASPLEHIAATLAAVQSELARMNELAAARERVIDRLHEDNQRLRAGERQLLLRPVIVDLYRLRNELLRQAATLPEAVDRAQAGQLLESFAYSAEQALERCEVYPICPSPGAEFDPLQHQVARDAVPASDAEQDGRIAEVLADGYRDGVTGRVLTPAKVKVARWTPPTGPEQQRPVDDGPVDDDGAPGQATPQSQLASAPAIQDQAVPNQAVQSQEVQNQATGPSSAEPSSG